MTRRPTTQAVDWQGLATAVDQVREIARALVAALVEDGFTDEQARAIAAHVLAGGPKS